MSRVIETFSTIILLILLILFLLHFLDGSATNWLKSKFVAQE